jgi:glyoxylase-like metal-dependent hydrolase (beta-lactamase superfamily II)
VPSASCGLSQGRHTFPAAPAGAIPTTVFQEEKTLHVNGSTLALKHYAPAHTDSDISVHFAEADILHTGGTFWNRSHGSYPETALWEVSRGSVDPPRNARSEESAAGPADAATCG